MLIAAAISATGFARELLLGGQLRYLTLVPSDVVLAETERNLRHKAPAALPVFESFLDQVRFVITEPGSVLVERVATIVELKDAAIVAGALSGKVHYPRHVGPATFAGPGVAIHDAFGVTVVTPDAVRETTTGKGRGQR
ncbi:MAG: hypothetical protein AAB289_02465 [Chloroflexota bacterium]